MAEGPKAVRFKFTRAANYRAVPVNGAWGAIAPNGVIAVDLYVERIALPETIVQRLHNGHFGPEERFPPDAEERLVEREAQIGLILTPESARAIGRWMLDKVDEYEKLAEATAPEQERTDATHHRARKNI